MASLWTRHFHCRSEGVANVLQEPYREVYAILQHLRGPPRSTTDLVKAVIQLTLVESIEIKRVPIKGSRLAPGVDSALVIVEDPPDPGDALQLSFTRAEIYIADDLEGYERRFAKFKECCQIFWSDDTAVQSTTDADLAFLLKALALANRRNGNAAMVPPSKALSAENLARYAALELMFPFASRVRAMAASANPTALSGKYSIPERYVKVLMDPAYHAICSRVWRPIYDGNSSP